MSDFIDRWLWVPALVVLGLIVWALVNGDSDTPGCYADDAGYYCEESEDEPFELDH